MRKFAGLMSILALFCFVFGGVSSAAQPVEMPAQYATPTGVDLGTYPLMAGALNSRQMAELGLRPVVLKTDTVIVNWHGRQGRFVVERLIAGTTVLVNASGEMVYKADCGNRISALPVPPPASMALRPPSPAPRSHWALFWDGVDRDLKALGAFLGPIFWPILLFCLGALGLIGILAIPLLLAWLLWWMANTAAWLWREHRRDQQRRRQSLQPEPPPPTEPSVLPVAPQPVVPPPSADDPLVEMTVPSDRRLDVDRAGTRTHVTVR